MKVFGFKEWKLVCDAMERGLQNIILRKGGISEGKHGFQWLHREFFLFPTYFHEQSGRLRLDWEIDPAELPTKDRDAVEIRLWAEIEEMREIGDLQEALALQDQHVWNQDVIEERFGWGENNGISMARVRLWRLAEPWVLENRESFGGCRSWLGLPAGEGLPEDWRETLIEVKAAERSTPDFKR